MPKSTLGIKRVTSRHAVKNPGGSAGRQAKSFKSNQTIGVAIRPPKTQLRVMSGKGVGVVRSF